MRRRLEVLGLVTLILLVVAPLARGATTPRLLSEGHPGTVRPLVDGMYLRSARSGQVYVIAGAAPLPVTNCSSFGQACQAAATVSQVAIDELRRLRPYPRNSTFLRSVDSTFIYRIAGGAPLWITDFSAVNGWRDFINVNQGAIESLPKEPRDGTLLRAAETGDLYRIESGSPVPAGTCSSVTSGCQNAVVLPHSTIELLGPPRVTGGTVLGDLLILLLTLSSLAVLVFLGLRSSLLAIAIFLFAFMLTSGIRDSFDPVRHVQQFWPGHVSGSLSIYTLDIFAVAFLTVGIYRTLTQRPLSNELRLIAILLLLLAIHILRGIPEYGLQPAVNSGRFPLYFLAALLFSATITTPRIHLAWQLITAAGLILIVTGSVFLLIQGLHTTREMITQGGATVASRPIYAAGALLALESVILLFGLGRRPSRVRQLLGALGLIVVFLFQTRTVWVAGAAAGLIVLAPRFIGKAREGSRTAILQWGLWAIGGLAIFSAIVLSSSTLRASIVDPLQPRSTLRWRLAGWRDLITAHHSLSDLSIGLPGGASLERTINFIPTTAVAHNFYIDTYLNFGLAGVAVLVTLLIMVWRGRAQVAKATGFHVTIVALMLLTQIVYAGGYALDAAQGLILGLFLAGLAAARVPNPPIPPALGAQDLTENGSQPSPTKVTAILTSHNRRAKTVACLRSYFAQQTPDRLVLDAVLVDDGSGDDTADAVRALASPTTIIPGTGDLWWSGGMALAEGHALSRACEYLLWLNDDVVLDEDCVDRLLGIAEERYNTCIVVGAVRDPASGEVTYSGVNQHRFHPLRFDRIAPGPAPVAVDTFDGNVVLVPRAVASSVGRIDARFGHAAADYDYGIRARRAGFMVLLAPGTVGTCVRDSAHAPWLDHSLPLRERTRLLLGRKGVPPGSRFRYLRRHGGFLWPVFWVSPYGRFLLSLLHPSSAGWTKR